MTYSHAIRVLQDIVNNNNGISINIIRKKVVVNCVSLNKILKFRITEIPNITTILNEEIDKVNRIYGYNLKKIQ